VIAKVAAHSGAVTTAIFLSDNKVIVTGSDDGGVSLWKANDFTRLRTLSSYSGGVQCMALSPNGKTLAIASGDFASAADPTKAEGALGLWNTATWNEEVTMSRQEVVSAVAFSPDGNLLAVGGTEGLIRLVDIAGNELAVLRGYIGKVRSICFSPDGTILASGSSDGTIRLSRVPKLKDRPE
jgi:WD40 repeat protein